VLKAGLRQKAICQEANYNGDLQPVDMGHTTPAKSVALRKNLKITVEQKLQKINIKK